MAWSSLPENPRSLLNVVQLAFAQPDSNAALAKSIPDRKFILISFINLEGQLRISS